MLSCQPLVMLGSLECGVNKVVERSDNNALEINPKKAEQIAFGSPSDFHKAPIVILNKKNQAIIFIEILGCHD